MGFKSEDLYLDTPLPLKQWTKKGRPKMWIKKYDQNGIKIYSEAGYGGIMISTQLNKAIGKDMAVLKDMVCFGPFYESTGLEVYVPYAKLIIT